MKHLGRGLVGTLWRRRGGGAGTLVEDVPSGSSLVEPADRLLVEEPPPRASEPILRILGGAGAAELTLDDGLDGRPRWSARSATSGDLDEASQNASSEETTSEGGERWRPVVPLLLMVLVLMLSPLLYDLSRWLRRLLTES